jgi:hypothetical protein
MFPRNMRRISPWKIAQTLSLFSQQIQESSWRGNQRAQNSFRQALEDAGIIRAGAPYDPHSGGPRTYEAQMRCLGLVFRRGDESIWLTRAGQDLVDAEPPLPILQSMLLRHQYPSVYSNLTQVNIHPEIKVKPFLFVLELLDHPDIQFLSPMELCVPVIYGHKRECLSLCVEKILKLRKGAGLPDILYDREHDLYTPRTAGGDLSARVRDVMDIGNTCKNYLQAACLISAEPDEDGRGEKIRINNEMRGPYEEAMQGVDSFIRNSDSEEAFQRAYGAWNREKDTRRLVSSGQTGAPLDKSIILAKFMQLCGEQAISGVPDQFFADMRSKYGFNRDLIDESLQHFLPRTLDYFESTFLQLSTGGIATATQFEVAICNLFNDRLLFKATHTGQLKRHGEKGGYADVFAVSLDNLACAIIDAKAMSSYSLPSGDYFKMTGNYIPNYSELSGGRNMKLEFAAYIAGGYTASINHSLGKVKNETGVPCSAIAARDLLAISKRSPDKNGHRNIRKMFIQGRKLGLSDF